MARFFTCCSPGQNSPFNGKDKLASGIPTKDSNCCTPAPVASYVSTPVIVLVPIVPPLIISGSANSSVVKYLKDKLQRIVKTILKARPLSLPPTIPVPAPFVAAAPHYKGPHEWPLKAWFSDISWDKTYLKWYNFFQKCEDHFAIADVTGPNRVLLAATFLKYTILLR